MEKLFSRSSLSISEEECQSIYSELNELNEHILNKYVELSTIKILNYLENNALNYNISLEFKYNIDHGFYYHSITCKDNLDNRDYNLEADLRKNFIIPSHYLQKLYKKDKKIEFLNNENNRDKVIEFMIGENWQQWKNETEIITHHENLSKKIPNKENNKESKKKI